MDKLEKCKETTKKKKGGLTGLIKKINRSVESLKDDIKEDGRRLILDLIVFATGFLLSRCHLILGARPLGLAFVAVTPTNVWSILGGTVIGYLSLGIDGLVYAAASIIIILLRAAVSGKSEDESKSDTMFTENLLIRMSISVIGGFLVSVYEVLMHGLDEVTLIYGLAMIIISPIITFIFSGLFSTGISLRELMLGNENPLKNIRNDQSEKNNKIFFQLSSLTLIFFISLSFQNVDVFGISLSYIFSVMITLISAKRFGAIRAMAVGFVSSLGISSSLAVSFALGGLCAGVMFGFGTGYAVIAGGVALCAWSTYSSGLGGLLSVLPEYSIAAALITPFLKKIDSTCVASEKPEEEPIDDTAEDMVGTMALAYQNRFSGSLDSLEMALMEMSRVINSYSNQSVRLTEEEYRDVVVDVAENRCVGCPESKLCAKENIRPSIKNADKLARLLFTGRRIRGENINTNTEFCHAADSLADEINKEAARREQECYATYGATGTGEEYKLISELLSKSKESDKREVVVNNSMTAPLTEAFRECGFTNGTIRVFGNRRKHFLLAGEDESGIKISSFELRKSIEQAAKVKLDTPEYYRRGKMVLMECDIRPALKVSYAIAQAAGNENEISGDTSLCFDSSGGYFYSLISDGMGSGRVARETSRFAGEFLRCALEIGSAKETIILMLNHSIRAKREECSATIDLFELDLLNGNGTFLKSGAAPSYVKRENSIFRIRSQTAPIGLLRSIDTEKINVEIRPGDHIIMVSDGIADMAEDAPWLLLLLGEEPKKNLNEYASFILEEAKKNVKTHDDMTVTVIRVDEI